MQATLAPLPALLPQRLDPRLLARSALRGDEVQDLRQLLLDHAAPHHQGSAVLRETVETLALASLGDNHLWQDLQLPSRAELSALMRHFFPALVARNHADMKWKKFLYKQLCEREALFICKAPSCAQCDDRPVCFGPED